MSKINNSDDQNNVSTFEAQIKSATIGLVTSVTALSPLFIILAILGIAVLNGYIEFLFQKAIFGSMAFAPAILLATMRFASGMGGVQLLKESKFVVGIFFICVSLALTFYVSMHILTIAETIAPDVPELGTFSLKVILWGGFIGELMIAGYMRALGNSARPLPAVNWWKATQKTNGQHVEN